MTGGKSSFFHFGAKTWRPKTAEQQFQEIQRKMMAEQEEIKKVEVEDRIKTLEQARKLEAKTQALNEMALAAEIKAKGNELQIRGRQVNEAKRLELAKLEIAKQEGRESLSEADLARIRNERLRAENLAKAARDHAIRENHRPVPKVDMGPSKVSIPPPPPVPHPLPPPIRPLSSHSVHRNHHGPPLHRPPSAQSMHRVSAGPPPKMHHATNSIGVHRLAPPQATPQMRRMSDSHAYPPAGFHQRPALVAPNHQSRGVAPGAYPNRHLRRHSGTMSAEIILRAHAERLRRRKLETLDLKARQHNLKLQALRDLRKRELVAELRNRGMQQREIETQVALLAERDRALNEAQLREMRDREHRLRLKEKGLQEREILDQIRRRQENDREALRRELEVLERQLQYKEVLEAELAIKRAIEKGESPPMGIIRPSMEDIETEGLLDDFYDDFDDVPSPYLNHGIGSEFGMSVAYRPRTPAGGHHSAHSVSHTPNLDSLSRAPSMGRRTPQVFPTSPAQSMRRGEEFLGDNMRTPARSRSQSFDHHRPSSAASNYRPRPESRSREREPTLSRRNSHASIRQDLVPLARPESRATLRDEEVREREKAEKKAQELQRLRQEIREREMNTSRRMPTPSAGHHRTPSMRDSLDPNYYNEGYHLDIPVRPSSRASTRVHDYDSISHPMSRAGSTRDGQSPMPQRLGLPSRPCSRNLTAEDLGLDFGRHSAEKVPMMNSAIHDEILSARLANADYNREINGGTRSRANSHLGPRHDDYHYGDPGHLASELNDMSFKGGRSRAGSHIGSPNDSFSRNPRGHPSPEFELNASNSMRSRSNSHARMPIESLSANVQRDHVGSELGNTDGRRSRANSILQAHGMSPSSHVTSDLNGQIIGRSRSPHGNGLPDHYGGEQGLGHLTNEELSQLSTEELELILNARGVRTPIGSEALSLTGFRNEMPSNPGGPAESLHGRHDSGGFMSGANSLGVGGSQSRRLNHRSSRLDVDESPLFGEARYSHSPMDPPRPLSRAESRQYGGSNLGQGYDQAIDPPRLRSSLNSPNPASFAHQVADRYPLPGHAPRDDNPQDFPYDVNEDEFIITEQPEPLEARIINIIGQVQASSPRSPAFGARYGRDVARDDMHLAVKNLITQASRLGANGIVSLRVNNSHDGNYLATGMAVQLEKL